MLLVLVANVVNESFYCGCVGWMDTGVYAVKPIDLLLKGRTHRSRRCVAPVKRRIGCIKAVAAPVAPPSADSAEDREQLAESYGFRQIGEDLPENVTLKDIMDTLPKEVCLFQ